MPWPKSRPFKPSPGQADVPHYVRTDELIFEEYDDTVIIETPQKLPMDMPPTGPQLQLVVGPASEQGARSPFVITVGRRSIDSSALPDDPLASPSTPTASIPARRSAGLIFAEDLEDVPGSLQDLRTTASPGSTNLGANVSNTVDTDSPKRNIEGVLTPESIDSKPTVPATPQSTPRMPTPSRPRPTKTRYNPVKFRLRIDRDNYRIQQVYRLHYHQHVVVAKSKNDAQDCRALRLRVGRVGYKQWLNEILVYLTPEFKHENILPFLGCDKTDNTRAHPDDMFNSNKLLGDMPQSKRFYPSSSSSSSSVDSDHDPSNDKDRARRREERRIAMNKKYYGIDYWILNDYSGCVTLRHYLMMHVLDWPSFIKIARGIMYGLNYLHEFADYRYNAKSKKTVVDSFIRSTNGAISKVSFNDYGYSIRMDPPLAITIIHRNLSSLNIVLKNQQTPCIWNFGYAYVYQPFQPLNFEHKVDKTIKAIHMTSPYSPPEVLSERSHFTLKAMKSIDMYSAGIILWEMMTRTVLPKLDNGTDQENMMRSDPGEYDEPWAREFRVSNDYIDPEMLKHAVHRCRARPTLKWFWLCGRKTHRVVETIRELWDQDYEARIHTATVISRLDKLSLRDRDKRRRYPMSKEREFNRDTMWPAFKDFFRTPLVTLKCESNIYMEEVEPEYSSHTSYLTSKAPSSAASLISV